MIQTPIQYLRNKEIRKHTPARISNGKEVYIYEGKEIEASVFLRMFPLADKVRQETLASQKGRTVDPRYIQ